MERSSKSHGWPSGIAGQLIHAVTQTIYLLCEGSIFLFGKKQSLRRVRALRKAEGLHWRARVLSRASNYEQAFQTAKQAFSALREGDPRETFPVLGGVLAELLDDLAQRLGRSGEILPQLREVLQVFSDMKSSMVQKSAAVDQVIAWLEYRVTSQT